MEIRNPRTLLRMVDERAVQLKLADTVRTRMAERAPALAQAQAALLAATKALEPLQQQYDQDAAVLEGHDGEAADLLTLVTTAATAMGWPVPETPEQVELRPTGAFPAVPAAQNQGATRPEHAEAS